MFLPQSVVPDRQRSMPRPAVHIEQRVESSHETKSHVFINLHVNSKANVTLLVKILVSLLFIRPVGNCICLLKQSEKLKYRSVTCEVLMLLIVSVDRYVLSCLLNFFFPD